MNMHPDYAAMLRTVASRPTKPVPKLALADWLEERGDPAHGAFREAARRHRAPAGPSDDDYHLLRHHDRRAWLCPMPGPQQYRNRSKAFLPRDLFDRLPATFDLTEYGEWRLGLRNGIEGVSPDNPPAVAHDEALWATIHDIPDLVSVRTVSMCWVGYREDTGRHVYAGAWVATYPDAGTAWDALAAAWRRGGVAAWRRGGVAAWRRRHESTQGGG